MGNYQCKYCNCPYNYYSDLKHATRNSCIVSTNNYHVFQYSLINKIEGIIEEFKNSCKK